MSDVVNAGFARSEQLKQEWDVLRSELQQLSPSSPRRQAIQTRMTQVTNEMSAVLSQTRKHIPTPDIDDDDDDDNNHQTIANHSNNILQSSPTQSPQPRIQYSKNRLHVIRRTYSSSEEGANDEDSDDDEDDDSYNVVQMIGRVAILEDDDSVPEAPDPGAYEDEENKMNVQQLREELMRGSGQADKRVETVEANNNKHTEKGLRAGLGELKSKLKDKLGREGAGSTLTEEERENFTLELSRLEREGRKLRRLPKRSRAEEKRLEEIALRITKIEGKIGTMSCTENGNHDARLEARRGSRIGSAMSGRGSGGRIERRKTIKFGKGSEKKDDTDVNEKESNQGGGKRRKGWLSLEAGVASIREMGRSWRSATSRGKEKEGSGGASGSVGGGGGGVSTRKAQGGQGNAFAEMGEKMKVRGEKLGSAAEGSEQMANDAGDMLAAVRMLKQRNQKTGLFS